MNAPAIDGSSQPRKSSGDRLEPRTQLEGVDLLQPHEGGGALGNQRRECLGALRRQARGTRLKELDDRDIEVRLR